MALHNRQPLFEETASLFVCEKTANFRARIIEWLNEAGLADKAGKVEIIAKVQELLISADAEVLDEFIDNVLVFGQDPVTDVKKAVVGFIEVVCKSHIKFLPRVTNLLVTLLRDASPVVQKRVIQAVGMIYKSALKWICTTNEITDSVESAWDHLGNMKAQIVDMIDHDNDGIRTNAIKCLEGIIILQTYPDEDSMKRPDDFSLDEVPMTLKIVKRRKLEDEAMYGLFRNIPIKCIKLNFLHFQEHFRHAHQVPRRLSHLLGESDRMHGNAVHHSQAEAVSNGSRRRGVEQAELEPATHSDRFADQLRAQTNQNAAADDS